MYRILVFSDIHGCADTLKSLIRKVEPTRKDKLIFLGDYIDCGDKSFEVVDYLINLSSKFDCVFLKGNHEDMMLRGVKDGDRNMTRMFIMNGGNATLKSYRGELNITNPRENISFDMFPQSHQDFYNNLKISHEIGNYLFVHAGVNPRYPLNNQMDEDKLWIRNEFLFHTGEVAEGKIVVHGHTPMEPNDLINYNDKYKDRINVDSACVFGYNLTCIDILTNKKYTQKMRDIKVV